MFSQPGSRGKFGKKFRVDTQVITSSAFWRKPSGAWMVYIDLCGAGGGGGGGGRNANGSSTNGGRGGHGGQRKRQWFMAKDIPDKMTVNVGSQTTSSAGATSNGGSGISGASGDWSLAQDSLLNTTILACRGGLGGHTGETVATLVLNSLTASNEMLGYMEGGTAHTPTTIAATVIQTIGNWPACGGGHGAPRLTADTAVSGARGGSPLESSVGGGGASGTGAAPGNPGLSGANEGDGGGGGGNCSGADGAGGAGGDGTIPGGGGGGGGAGRNGNGGAGGKGARGQCTIMTICLV